MKLLMVMREEEANGEYEGEGAFGACYLHRLLLRIATLCTLNK